MHSTKLYSSIPSRVRDLPLISGHLLRPYYDRASAYAGAFLSVGLFEFTTSDTTSRTRSSILVCPLKIQNARQMSEVLLVLLTPVFGKSISAALLWVKGTARLRVVRCQLCRGSHQ
jgi:hypothetical protein